MPVGRLRVRPPHARSGTVSEIRTIDPATLERWRAEHVTRSLYVFDVRTPAEYAAGHVPRA